MDVDTPFDVAGLILTAVSLCMQHEKYSRARHLLFKCDASANLRHVTPVFRFFDSPYHMETHMARWGTYWWPVVAEPFDWPLFQHFLRCGIKVPPPGYQPRWYRDYLARCYHCHDVTLALLYALRAKRLASHDVRRLLGQRVWATRHDAALWGPTKMTGVELRVTARTTYHVAWAGLALVAGAVLSLRGCSVLDALLVAAVLALLFHFL